MDKANIQKVVRATNGPKHHLFGFHDLIATNISGDKLLSLEVETFNRPPLPEENAGVGYVDIFTHNFIELCKTNAFNYPQGARQQWIDDTHFIVNNQVGGHWGADIYDVEQRRNVRSLDAPCHCLSPDKKCAYSINYSRLHRLGGYGYIGVPDKTAEEETPDDDGIFITDIETNQTRLLVSIAEVAACQPESSLHNGNHHYLTHLVVSPNGKRIAFLHRCFFADGGIRTRIMTIGVDGEGLRCLAYGFLSHFDWKDDEHIFIWGRPSSSIDTMRSTPIFSNPMLSPIFSIAKTIAKKLLKKKVSSNMSFLMLSDTNPSQIKPFAQGVLTCDGHPMTCPTDNDLCICDTYPDKNMERTLFTYRFSTNERIDLGRFRMINEQPDGSLFNQYTEGVDAGIIKMFSPDLYSFTRSGLHCDLHPRWSADGKYAIFDSIHEGSRQIYMCQIVK